MNELNYASLSASKKLVENGIWLETDYFYVNTFSNMGWVFRQKGGFNDEDDFVPAPSMAEVWRELPEETVCKKQYDVTKCTNVSTYDLKVFFNSNPTDALIELLIWLKGEMIRNSRNVICF
jgi:hypothetical protein